MSEPYIFEYDGLQIEFRRNTVGSTLEAARIQDKLLGALGYVTGNPAPQSEAANIAEFAECMSRCKVDAAWWGHSNMSEDQLAIAYQTYIDEPGELVVGFRRADSATKLPKKTKPAPPTT